jgi:hypothetical protein
MSRNMTSLVREFYVADNALGLMAEVCVGRDWRQCVDQNLLGRQKWKALGAWRCLLSTYQLHDQERRTGSPLMGASLTK